MTFCVNSTQTSRQTNGTETVSISFTTVNVPAAWQVGDVLLDPFSSH